MKKKFILLILLLFIFNQNVFADSNLIECEYSEEYKKYLLLDEEEKKKVIKPNTCASEDELKNKNTFNSFFKPYDNFSFGIGGINTLPSYFDLRNVNGNNYVTSVKNQEDSEVCWSFATMASVESNILLNSGKTYDFSDLHTSYSMSEKYFSNNEYNELGIPNEVIGSWGNTDTSSAYMIRHSGPILESSFSFEDYYDRTNSSRNNHLKETLIENVKSKAIVDVNNIDYIYNESCTDDSIEEIKTIIKNHGAVTAAYRPSSNNINDIYHNYNGSETGTTHLVSIIGWDDSIAANNFDSRPTRQGAFIVKNSWGDGKYLYDLEERIRWISQSAVNGGYYDKIEDVPRSLAISNLERNGYVINEKEGTAYLEIDNNEGFYYVSYEDKNICKYITSFNDVDFEVEDNVYFYDTIGFNTSIGNANKSDWAANLFSTDNSEILKEVTFYSLGSGEYNVYLSQSNNNEEVNLSEKKLLGTVNSEYSGYHTLNLENNVVIKNDFAIIIEYKSTNDSPIGVQYNSNISNKQGQSFKSEDGVNWKDIHDSNIYYIPSIKAYTNNIDYDFSIGEVTRREETKDKFNIPIALTNITNESDKDFDIKVMDSNENDVTNEFTINDYIKANNYVEIEKKSLDTENGEYKVEITYDLLTYDTTIEVTNSNPTIDLGNISFKSNNIYLDDNKIYDLYGGIITIPVILYGLENNGFSIEVINMNGIKQDFKVQLNPIVNNETSIQVTIPKNTKSDGYTVKVSNGEINNQINFKVYDFIEVEDITFKYEDEKLDEIILLKEDSILVEGIISNDSTLNDIEYYVENSTDKQVVSLTNDNQLYGNDTGTVNLVAKVGDQQFKIPITVIDVPNITYDKITYTSNVGGNIKIDNYFGGKIEIEKTTTNKTDSMMSGGMGNVLGSCISYNYDIENKVIINISGSCGLTGGESLRLDAGNYTYEEKIIVFDTKRTVKKFAIEYEIVEYIPLKSITSNLEKINLKTNDTYNLFNNINLSFEPTNATNKNIKYVGYDEEIVNINNEGTITALKAGITTIKVMSIYNEEIYDTISVMVNPNIKEIETNIESNYNNKLYYGYGGKVTANITTENIIENERLTIKYYKDDIEQNDMTSIFDTTNRLISNNETSINLYVGRDQAIGTYKIELCYEKAECKSFEFEVIEPKKVTSIEANDIIISNDGPLSNINYEIKPSDAFNQNVEFKVADTSIAKVEDGKIKGLKEGNTTLTIKALDGSNISKTVNVSVVEKSIVIDNIKLENDIVYETFGGKLSFRISLINIDSTNVDLEISDENNNIIHEENVTLNDKGYKDIEYDISKELKAGTYKIKVTDGNFEKNATFQVASYKPVENIKFMYNQKELSNLVLLNEDEIAITSVITNEDATFKEISYSIKDTTIARITNEGLIYGIKVGKTELIASVGFQTFTLPIEITNDSGVEYSSLNIYSNVNGNNTIDNHYGGKYTIEATFDDINTNKEITLKNISLKNSSISQFGTFAFKANEIKNNKSLLEVTFTEYQSIPGLNSGIFNASGGTYIVSYNYTINDTKETKLSSSFEIELKDFVELAKINLTKTEIKLDVNESINVNNLISFEPNNVTNKNVNYDVSNSNVLKLNGITITGLSEGTSTVTITSEENENVKAIINVTVEKNDFLEFSNKVNIHTESGSKYLKGMLTKSTYNDLMTNISTNLDVVLKKADGKIVNEDSELIGTGMKLHVGNNSYDIVIKGDVSGDGKMTVTDVSQLIRHLAKVPGKIKTGAYKIAGDMNDSNTITVTDLSQMIKKIAGVK